MTLNGALTSATAGLFAALPAVAVAAPIGLTCLWTHPTNPRLTERWTMTVDSSASAVTHSRGPVSKVVVSPADVRFSVVVRGWEWGYTLDRTTLILTQLNLTGGGPASEFICTKVAPRV